LIDWSVIFPVNLNCFSSATLLRREAVERQRQEAERALYVRAVEQEEENV
jgi:hypothetical protein